MKNKLKFYGPFVVIILILIGWAILFNIVSPAVIVQKIGIQNAYIFAFVLAVICGFSSITGATFYAAVLTLASGGLNPLILGIVGGLGLCISDFAFFFVVSHGTAVIDKHWEGLSTFIKKWLSRMPAWFIYIFVFLYSAFAPIPNDIMLVSLAIGKTSFKKFAPYLFLGDIVSVIVLAYIGY
ncbi:MAG: hypothetical protein JWN37_690 [Candidatus Nomurabacteria bacterium]|nr:hypothetical protein [Candidatus Nomurabacteria bacterium]